MLSATAPTSCKTVFLHTSKTGGSTFRNSLAALYGPRFHQCEDPSLNGIVRDFDRYECVELHIQNTASKGWVCLNSELAAQGRWDLLEHRDTFIMFREPVDQILSNYFYMVSLRARIEPRMKAIGVRFPESIEDYIESPEYFNNQTAFVLGKSQQGGDLVGPADLAKAKELLQRLKIHVGLTERFADSMRIFERVTGKKLPPVPKANQTANRPSVDEIPMAIRERIREKSALDVELYRFAKQLFQQDFERRLAPTPAASRLSKLRLAQWTKTRLFQAIPIEHVVRVKRD